MKEQVAILYSTYPNLEEAKRMGKKLLEKNLCACVNVFPVVMSMFWWNGRIEKATESAMIIKTNKKLVKDVIKEIVKHHPYSCPCILELSVGGGYEPFIKWIVEETTHLTFQGKR